MQERRQPQHGRVIREWEDSYITLFRVVEGNETCGREKVKNPWNEMLKSDLNVYIS